MTERATNLKPVFQENTGVGSLATNLDEYLKELNAIQNAAQIVRVFSYCSDATGDYVQMRPEYQYIPILIGADNRTTPLYHFVEVLDELVDYDLVVSELPHLSYAQVSGALSFLRRLAQVNPRNIDPDLFDDEEIAEDPVFMDELRKALADKETSRVLNRD